MSDFITMQCPNCGGKLNIAPNTFALKCEYCGCEHYIRREERGIILEGFARCPTCKLNDRATKITSLTEKWPQPPKPSIPLEPPKIKIHIRVMVGGG